MKAGRELDALVAERVMGWKAIPHPNPDMLFPGVVPEPSWFPPGFDYHAVKDQYSPGLANGVAFPDYSTEIAAAWEVFVKALAGQIIGYTPCPLMPGEKREDHLEYFATVFGKPVFGDTAPHAICLAALKAIGHNVEEPK